MRIAFALLMVLSLAGCDEKVSEAAKSRDVPVMSAIMNCGLPADWQYRGLGGGGGDDGGGYGWEISLGNRSHDQVMRDLSGILKKSVTGCGLVVGGGGETRSNGTLDGFSFCAKGGTSKGRVLVSSAPIDANKILVLVAVVQINAWEAP